MATVDARAKILEAADALFGEAGFDATSTRQISEQSGVNKALIHYHFRTKDALFGEVLDRYYEELGALLRDRLATGDSVRERLHAVVSTYVDFLERHQSFSRMVQREVMQGARQEQILTHMRPLFALGAKLIEAAYPAAADATRPLAAAQLMVSVYGMIVSYFSFSAVIAPLLKRDPLAPESIALRKQHLHTMVELIVDALETRAR